MTKLCTSLPRATEGPTTRTIGAWIESLGGCGTAFKLGADLYFDSRSRFGPVIVRAMSPFVAATGVEALCQPCLVRVDIDAPCPPLRPHWAIRPLPGGTIAAARSSDDGISAVLFSSAPSNESLGAAVGVPLFPGTIQSFLAWVRSLAEADETGRRRESWKAIDELVARARGEQTALATIVRRVIEPLFFAGAGAGLLSYLSLPLGELAVELLPLTASLGAALGFSIGTSGSQPRGLVPSKQALSAIAADLEESEVFRWNHQLDKPLVAQTFGVLTHIESREVRRAHIVLERRIEARASGTEVSLIIDLLRFLTPAQTDPRAAVLPEAFATLRVVAPRRLGLAPLGRLEPLDDADALGCMLSLDELHRGALGQALAPLAAVLRLSARGPYR